MSFIQRVVRKPKCNMFLCWLTGFSSPERCMTGSLMRELWLAFLYNAKALCGKACLTCRWQFTAVTLDLSDPALPVKSNEILWNDLKCSRVNQNVDVLVFKVLSKDPQPVNIIAKIPLKDWIFVYEMCSDVGHWDNKTFYQTSARHESLNMKKFGPVAWVNPRAHLHSLNLSQ